MTYQSCNLMRLYFGQRATWFNEANFWMKHTPDTGSIAEPGGPVIDKMLTTYHRSITDIAQKYY
jgi:hypothetical protein